MSTKRQAAKSKERMFEVPWDTGTELLGLEFVLIPESPTLLPSDYPRLLHSWFLNQIKEVDRQLSAAMHDRQDEKPFSISPLQGHLEVTSRHYELQPRESYRWQVTALNQRVVEGLALWLSHLPSAVVLKNTKTDATLKISTWKVILPPKTYTQVWQEDIPESGKLQLSFLSPTSFRSNNHSLPLPNPRHIFQSYLRRWNTFTNHPVNEDDFLNWVDYYVVITRHQLESTTATVREQDQAPAFVTGFTGYVELRLLAKEPADYVRLFWSLGNLAPYSGTGYKTPQGMGLTRLKLWQGETRQLVPKLQTLLSERITELSELFFNQRKRLGGERALHAAETWATLLARREFGEGLEEIATDLNIPYETAKTYVKKARQALRDLNGDSQSDRNGT